MAKITISDILGNQVNEDFTLSEIASRETNAVFGGREVFKIDLDDDGKWEIRIFETRNTVKIKIRA